MLQLWPRLPADLRDEKLYSDLMRHLRLRLEKGSRGTTWSPPAALAAELWEWLPGSSDVRLLRALLRQLPRQLGDKEQRLRLWPGDDFIEISRKETCLGLKNDLKMLLKRAYINLKVETPWSSVRLQAVTRDEIFNRVRGELLGDESFQKVAQSISKDGAHTTFEIDDSLRLV